SSSTTLAPTCCAAGNERLKGSPSDFRQTPSLIRPIVFLACSNHRTFMAKISKRPRRLLEHALRQPDCPPLRAAHLHMLAVIIQRHRAKQIDFVLVTPDIR